LAHHQRSQSQACGPDDAFAGGRGIAVRRKLALKIVGSNDNMLAQSGRWNMSRFKSQAAADVAWRVDQMHANNAIEGIERDLELSAFAEQMEREGLSDDEQIARLVELAKEGSNSVLALYSFLL
jgi:hypothetical protein